tara:strand:- start:11852 stop:12376 length:525 start_codon:yes stop_codon:yes gene_type:complete
MILYLSLLSILNAFMYRLRGSTWLPIKVLKNLLVLAVVTGAFYLIFPVWYVLLIPVLGYLGITMGHGSYMDLGTNTNIDNERFKPLLDWIFGVEPPVNFYRDFTGLALTGLAFSLPIALLWFLIPTFPLWYGAIGILKAPAYYIAKLLYEPKYTLIGELLWGFFMISPLLLLYI